MISIVGHTIKVYLKPRFKTLADNWKSLENELSLEIWAKWNFFVQRKLSAIMSRDDLNYTCQIIALFIHCNEAMKIKNSLWWNDEFAMKIKELF